jgi:hypothetical protein
LPKNELGVPAPPNHGCDAVVEVNSAVAAEFLGKNPDAKFKVTSAVSTLARICLCFVHLCLSMCTLSHLPFE